MDPDFIEKQEKARRQTIYCKDGSLRRTQSYVKRSICNVHLILAEEIEKGLYPDSEKIKLLLLVDEAYQLGKRMATKLDYYGAEKDKT